jgi:hypothetical protein
VWTDSWINPGQYRIVPQSSRSAHHERT